MNAIISNICNLKFIYFLLPNGVIQKEIKCFFGFQKIENDYSVRKRITFLQNGQINIYVNNKIYFLSKFIVSIEELNEF